MQPLLAAEERCVLCKGNDATKKDSRLRELAVKRSIVELTVKRDEAYAAGKQKVLRSTQVFACGKAFRTNSMKAGQRV